jgi:microsomal dipeptidase-like Zn-dependent dipeptidase
LAIASLIGGTACGDDTGEMDTEGPELDLTSFAGGCYTIRSGDQWLGRGGDGFAFGSEADAEPFTMQASDLGTYLFYDGGGQYFVSDDGSLERRGELESDLTQLDDDFISGAEWTLESSERDWNLYQLRNRKTGDLLGNAALTEDSAAASIVTFEEADGCIAHPELTLDASGEVMKTTWEDGDLYGIVDTHSHILSNFGFGGGGIFHGSPFHRLGVEHAMGSCEQFHGEDGRKDFFGYAFDTAGADGVDLTTILADLVDGQLMQPNHATDGYPSFTEWPNARERSTHQTQYYRWLERAHLAGLRLVVQHATTNSVICNLTAGEDYQEVRYSCDDMVAVDRILEETYNMERYIDAQAGGKGEGFFRIVQSPGEAREVIEEGKMAVVLGIEASDLFDCRLSAFDGDPLCDVDYVRQQLDAYYDMGVRALFPVHKYDNAFSAGDGDRTFIELGNFLNSGYWSNFTEDCPDVPSVFDKGDVFFGGLNMPRDEYMTEAPNDVSGFPANPLGVAFQYIGEIGGGPLEGDYCQNHGLTGLGETLMEEMMMRGMIIEIDHFSKRSYERAFQMLVEADYPAAGTHGMNNSGELYALGGVSKTGLGRCREAAGPGAMVRGLQDRVALIEANGGYPAEGFGFDLNGFAGAPGPRFPDGACGDPQTDPVTYPFRSYADDVEFTEPAVGDRTIDFNMEGFVHIGMLPELLQDARGDLVNPDDLDPLFRSAEAYIRMWERAEERSEALRSGG